MTAGAQWLETYIICQVLLAGALVWVRLTRGGRSPHRTLWLARMVFLGVVFTPSRRSSLWMRCHAWISRRSS